MRTWLCPCTTSPLPKRSRWLIVLSASTRKSVSSPLPRRMINGALSPDCPSCVCCCSSPAAIPCKLSLPPCAPPLATKRDKFQGPIQIKASQFESYGHLLHRDQQTLLLGRLHIDPQNSMAFKDWGLLGSFETARLSNLPIQNAARRSAGGAFVGMQVAASLERGILLPP